MDEVVDDPRARVQAAIGELAARQGPGQGVSVRQIAALAGCAHSTAQVWRDRLVEDGLIELTDRGPREAPAVRVLNGAT